MCMIVEVFNRYLTSSVKGLNGDSDPDVCDAGAPLNQLSHQVDWELVVL